jgi:hypothetical protein
MWFSRRWAPVILLGMAWGTAQGADHPDLSGQWRLNAEMSQNLVSKIHAATGGQDGRSDVERTRAREALLALARAGETLEIQQRADEFQIAYANDDVQIFYPGRQHVRERSGIKVQVSPRWEADAPVIEQGFEGGAKGVENYSLIDGGARLVILARLESKELKEPLVARMVYDRVAPRP